MFWSGDCSIIGPKGLRVYAPLFICAHTNLESCTPLSHSQRESKSVESSRKNTIFFWDGFLAREHSTQWFIQYHDSQSVWKMAPRPKIAFQYTYSCYKLAIMHDESKELILCTFFSFSLPENTKLKLTLWQWWDFLRHLLIKTTTIWQLISTSAKPPHLPLQGWNLVTKKCSVDSSKLTILSVRSALRTSYTATPCLQNYPVHFPPLTKWEQHSNYPCSPLTSVPVHHPDNTCLHMPPHFHQLKT